MPLEADAAAPQRGGEPLDVIVLNDFATVAGGTDQVALAEACGLARRGHRVTLLAGAGEPEPELLQAGVRVRSTGQPSTLADPNPARAAARGIWNRASAAIVRQLAAGAAGRPTVVHLHGYTKVLSASVVRAALASGLPTVATLHDYFAACPNGSFFNYQSEEICLLTPLSPRCVATHCDARAYSHKLWRVGRAVVQRGPGQMPRGVSDFIAPSRSAANIVAPFLPTAARVHVVPSPVAVRREPPAPVAPGGAFVFVGRLQRDKGATLFARAARDANVPAIFVGEGEEADAVRAALPGAQLTGWVEPERVRAIVRGARAVVNPSLVHETQGLTVLEAAADGVPTIVSDGSVARDAVSDGVTGVWFRRGSVVDLAGQLRRLHADRDLAARLGAGAYEWFWSQERGLDAHLDRVEAVYRCALSADPARATPALARGHRPASSR
jgi:glycosyltransferase involved in cell wall biosynthesis